MIARIYKAPKATGHKFELILCANPSTHAGVKTYHAGLREAKAAAKAAGAKPWNY